jgi:chromosome segregation ATPase
MEDNMFGMKLVSENTARKLEQYENEIKSLREKKNGLEMDIEKIKLEKKNEMEDTKHLVKLRDEKRELEFERKEMNIESEKEREVASVKDEYRDKMEEQLANETKNIKEMYGQILERLPSIKVGLKGDAG